MSKAFLVPMFDRRNNLGNICLDAPPSAVGKNNRISSEWKINPLCGAEQIAAWVWPQMPASYVFGRSGALQSEFLYGQLSQLQEYSQKLKRAARSLTQERESLDTRLWWYETSQETAQTSGLARWIVSTTEPNVLAPSLNLPFTQDPFFFGSIQEDVWAYVVSIDRKISESLRNRQQQLQEAIRRVNETVAVILQKIACSVTGFFCGMRWERRRWFLRHGARPPKKRLEAISSLFPEACLGL